MMTLPDGAAEATEWSSAGATASAIRDKIRIQVMALLDDPGLSREAAGRPGKAAGAYLLSDMSKALMRSSLRAFQLSRLLAPYRSSCWYSGTAGISSTQSLLMR